MSIGFATWTLEDTPVAQYAEELADMGYDGVEISADGRRRPGPQGRSQPVDDRDLMSTQELRTTLDRYGLRVLAVTAKNGIDPAHPLHSHRQRALEYYRDLLVYCGELGCQRLVIREQPGRVRPIVGRAKELAMFKQTIGALARSSASMNVHLSLLPVNRYEGFLANTVQDGLDLLEDTEHTTTDLALNSYHMNIEESGIVGALRAAEGRIGHFYAAENHRRALGEGHLDWPEICLVLAQGGYKGDYIIECQALGAEPLRSAGRLPGWPEQVLEYAERSIEHLRVALAAAWP